MSFRCSATLTFPPPSPLICGAGNPGIIVSISEDLSSGIYWDLITDTNGHPFTNPSNFPLSVGDSICSNVSNEVLSFTDNVITAQFFIDSPANPITNQFPGGNNLTPALANFFANSNLTNPNATITITSGEGGSIQAVITITDSVTHTQAGLQVFADGTPVFFFEAPLTCELIKKKKRRPAAFKPYIYIPVNDLPYIGRWNVSCRDSGSNICCYAWSGTIVGSVQCVSYRKTNSQYIEDAIAEAQARTPYPVIRPIESGSITYVYDGIENNFYRFRAPIVPPALRPGSILIGR